MPSFSEHKLFIMSLFSRIVHTLFMIWIFFKLFFDFLDIFPAWYNWIPYFCLFLQARKGWERRICAGFEKFGFIGGFPDYMWFHRASTSSFQFWLTVSNSRFCCSSACWQRFVHLIICLVDLWKKVIHWAQRFQLLW